MRQKPDSLEHHLLAVISEDFLQRNLQTPFRRNGLDQGFRIAYSATEIDFYAALNRQALGYEPPQVMLIHDSLLNADSIDDLLGLFHDRGYRFMTLSEAQHDPAYSIPGTYVTKYGILWDYRWAEERHIGRLGMHEPEPPDWIIRYADGRSDRPQSMNSRH